MSDHYYHATYRKDIDGLRALAVLAVVVYHAFPTLLPGGFVGVDLFFVISGFLISSIIFRSLEKGGFRFLEFYKRRVRRIFPALSLVLCCCLFAGWGLLLSEEYALLGKHVAAGAGFSINFILWTESGYFDQASNLKPLMHLWSLAIEEQFYLIYPPLVVWLWKRGQSIGKSLVFVFALSFVVCLYLTNSEPVLAFFMPYTRFWELLAGGLLAYATVRKAQHCSPDDVKKASWFLPIQRSFCFVHGGANHFLSVLGFALVGSSFLLFREGQPFPGWAAMLPILGAVFLILAGPAGVLNKHVLSLRPMVWIGLISYPLYLWHWPVLSFLRILEASAPSRLFRFEAVLLSFALAIATYFFVEKPLRFGPHGKQKALGLIGAVFVFGLAGAGVYMMQGFPKRYAAFEKMNIAPFLWVDETGHDRRENALCRDRYPDFQWKFCSLYKNQDPVVALVGDSHSMALQDGLAAALWKRKLNMVNWGAPSCLPVFDAEYLSNGSMWKAGSTKDCRRQMNDILTRILSSKTVHTVILSHYSIDDPVLPALREEQQPVSSDWFVFYEKALSKTVKRLQEGGKRVIVVLDVPHLPFLPKTCVRHHPVTLSHQVRSECSFSKELFNETSQKYRSSVMKTLRTNPSVEVYDPSEVLCRDGSCQGFLDGRLLYVDAHHLSRFGGEIVGEALSETLFKDNNQ